MVNKVGELIPLNEAVEFEGFVLEAGGSMLIRGKDGEVRFYHHLDADTFYPIPGFEILLHHDGQYTTAFGARYADGGQDGGEEVQQESQKSEDGQNQNGKIRRKRIQNQARD